MATPFSSVPAKALVFAGIAALAACGGGTSAGTPGAGPNLQSDARADQSIKHEVVPNPYPTTIGEQWKYNYTLVLANSPGTVQDTTGTIATTLQSQTTFNGNPVFDYHSVFNYSSGADGGITGTTTTDNYEYFVGSYYYYYGNSITGSESSPKYSNTSTDAQTYPTPFILDILPESNGNHATEPGAYTLTATSTSTANGGTDVSESYSRANSGASTTAETITLAGTPYSVSETINADYSATLNNGVPGQGDTGTTTFSAPSADYVNVVYTPTVGSPVSTTVPVWWGSTPLLSDTFKQIASAAPVPARCKSNYTGQSSVELRESLSYVDPIQGSTDVETTDRFVISGIGVVCANNTRLISYFNNRTNGELAGTTSISVLQGLATYTASRTKGPDEIVGFGPFAGPGARLPLPLGLKLDSFPGKKH